MERTIGSVTDDELAAHAALGGTPTPRLFSDPEPRGLLGRLAARHPQPAPQPEWVRRLGVNAKVLV